MRSSDVVLILRPLFILVLLDDPALNAQDGHFRVTLQALDAAASARAF